MLNNLGCINAAASLGAFMIDGGDLSNVADLRQLTNLGLKFTELHAIRIVSRIKEFQQSGVPVEYLVANTLAPNVAADTGNCIYCTICFAFCYSFNFLHAFLPVNCVN